MHKMATAVLLIGLLLNVLLFSIACDPDDSNSTQKWEKYVRGIVITPATEDNFGIIEVGTSHERKSIVLYNINESDGLDYRETVYFKLHELGGIPLAKEFNKRPEALSDIYGGEVKTLLSYHSFFNHLHPGKSEEGKEGIPIHYKLHLVSGIQISGEEVKWTFKGAGSAPDLTLIGNGDFYDEFNNVTGEVYVLYEIQNLPGGTDEYILIDMDLEHRH